MSRRLLILAEASERIGTGHVVESFQLCREALERSLEVTFLVNAECPSDLLRHSPVPPEIIPDFSVPELVRALEGRNSLAGCVALTNFRRVSNDQLFPLAAFSTKVGCIDEWGQRSIECDVIFNNTIVDRYHRYTSSQPNFRLCTGPDYMALGCEFAEFNRKPRQGGNGIRSIVVAMGGTDPSSVTCTLLEAILPRWPDLKADIVLGVNFKEFDRLNRIQSSGVPQQMRVHRNLKSLASLLFEADVGFTIGGNTLCELACVGTPALTLFDDDHEREQAEEFERRGFGYCLGSVRGSESERIVRGLSRFQDRALRERHSETGRRLVDGGGVKRIMDVLLGGPESFSD